MFERFYKQHLSKRLLAGRVTNDSVEQLMLQKLKTECGYQFTCKLEGMFTDMKTSEDTMRSFRQHLKDKDIDLRAEISVHVRSKPLSIT
jgi:cullin 3